MVNAKADLICSYSYILWSYLAAIDKKGLLIGDYEKEQNRQKMRNINNRECSLFIDGGSGHRFILGAIHYLIIGIYYF